MPVETLHHPVWLGEISRVSRTPMAQITSPVRRPGRSRSRVRLRSVSPCRRERGGGCAVFGRPARRSAEDQLRHRVDVPAAVWAFGKAQEGGTYDSHSFGCNACV